MDPELIFSAYRSRLERRKVSDTTLREYKITTEAFAGWLKAAGKDMEDVRRTDVEDFFADSGWAPSTQRARLTYLRAPWKYAVHETGALERSPFEGLAIELEKVPDREPIIIPNATLRAIKHRITNNGDYALFCCLAYTGMRTMEVRGLMWEGVSMANQTLQFIGKGNKQRTIPMHPCLAEAFTDYPVFSYGSAWVFPGAKGQGMGRVGMWKRIKRICLPDEVEPHSFRRTVATSLEHNEARESAIVQILGHSTAGNLRLAHYTALSQKQLYREMLKLYADDPV